MPSRRYCRDGILFLLLLMKFINVNGKILEEDTAFIKTDNHSYRYGDGLFETMKVMDGRILLSDLHFERLFNGLSILKLHVPPYFNQQDLKKEILDLCRRNNGEQPGRVRLSISGGNGGLYDGDESVQYLVECRPLDYAVNELNENGLVIGVFPDAKKSCDVFSNLKSASHLPYTIAARFAKEHKLNDCLLLNVFNRICDSTIANVFWIKDKQVFTPPLSEGCIAGVMRRYLIESLQDTRYKVRDKKCEIEDLENADEIFLTNAIQGIRWVKQFRDKIYTDTITKDIYRSIKP
jgi:branched-chain amino acid aminotransferase